MKTAPRRKRGELKVAVLDCLRNRIGVVGQIKERLAVRGIEASANSISNCIYRLRRNGVVRFNAETDRWIIIEDSPERFIRDRNLSPEPKNPPAEADGPLKLNGEAEVAMSVTATSA